ncbi:MAG: Serine-tRNA ligase [Parcubacteria group bacterium GW2011_GWB1_44_7]|nr:MAG: Serine-tRNA ligase [Parcubacteria group bacterium GW2011_GWB1_44_7]
MLDIKFIRANQELIQEAAKKKQLKFKVADLIAIDDQRRELLVRIEQWRAEQNAFNERLAKITEPKKRLEAIAEMKKLKEPLQKDEEELKKVMKSWQLLMIEAPNVPDVSVPEGKDDSGNKEIRTWGNPPKFYFPVKNHIELMEKLALVDFESGAKVAGFRGYFLKNEAAVLSLALWQFVFDYFVNKKKFTPMLAPALVRRENLVGAGYLPQGEEDLYKTQDGDFLAGTAEVSAMGCFMDTVIPKEKLPIKIIAFSPCFRREAGSHGKDTKGLFRVHEFYKMEQVIIGEASHVQSVEYHEELTANAEEIMQALKIPYRVVVNCAGDLGLGQVKKYDIEAWLPSENKYRETHSISYFHDFQTRRLNIRYKDTTGKIQFAHSLNGTALPTPRPLIALLENNQQPDGSIAVPKILQKYVGKETISAN